MADSADPANRPNFTHEQLVAFFGRAVEKLVAAGVPPDLLVSALKQAATDAEILHSKSQRKLDVAAQRLQAVAEAGLREEGGYAGPDRRGPGRPWAK